MLEFVSDDLLNFGWKDLLDIVLMSFIFYRILLLVEGTRTIQMFTGLILVLISFLLFNYLELTVMRMILNNIFASFAVILVVLFQGDLRLALAKIGTTNFFVQEKSALINTFNLDKLASACEFFSQTHTGCLIVIEKEIGLRNYTKSGTEINAMLSSGLLMSIFNKTSPLHDGAVILSKNLEVISAGSILPLSQSQDLISKYGTRHRAAIGLMEESDAYVIVVSEETGKISFGINGVLEELETYQLKVRLYAIFGS